MFRISEDIGKRFDASLVSGPHVKYIRMKWQMVAWDTEWVAGFPVKGGQRN
jgi:hypothetical protein